MKVRIHSVVIGLVAVAILVGSYLTLIKAQEPPVDADETTPHTVQPKEEAVSLPKVTIAPKSELPKNRDGVYLTRNAQFIFTVSTDKSATGDRIPYVNSISQLKNKIGANGDITVELTREGANTVSVSLERQDGPRVSSNSMVAELDTVGPMLKHAELVELPGKGTTLLVSFADDDFGAVARNQFLVNRQDKDGEFVDAVLPQGNPVVDGRTVRLYFASLQAGQYQLEVKGTPATVSAPSGQGAGDDEIEKAAGTQPLTDQAGNYAGGTGHQGKDQTWVFSVLPERKFGKHVEFTPYAPPEKQEIPPEGFNPADFVTTRVSRLYYYRDAERVAQIINRNIRSYNQAAVTQAERRAENARDDFEDRVDARRKSERDAIRAAQAARNAESKLAAAREVQGLAEDTEAQIKALEEEKAELNEQLTEVNALEATAKTHERTAVAKEKEAQDARKTAQDAQATANQAAAALTLAGAQLSDALARMPQSNDEIAAARTNRDDKRQLASAAQASAETFNARAAVAINEANEARETADQSRAAAVARAGALQTDKIRQAVDRMDTEIQRLRERQAKIGTSESLDATVGAMEQSIANLRQTEIVKDEASHDAQAAEDRAASRKFRAEVEAAETDPDTYVAGDIHSVDPVTQVSISVIGEGLIQLRGPIKGINKVRTMINQIDSPVGQIKIGIHTVQVNGEKGDEMEEVVGDIEGQIDRSRFLVNQSLSMLRRAIQMEAAEIAARNPAGHYQVDRDRRYLYTFFGRDFIDELYEMNSEFLFTENKLLSMHAMDTISLNRALFVLALAKNDVRQRIVMRFLSMVEEELPQAEWDFYRSSGLFRPTHRIFHSKSKQEAAAMQCIFQNAAERYHFRNLRGFFDVGISDADTMNATQREFVRLAQIFKSRLIAEMELKQRIIERGLIEDPANSDERRQALLKPVHDAALELVRDAYQNLVNSARLNQQSLQLANQMINSILEFEDLYRRLDASKSQIRQVANRQYGDLMENSALEEDNFTFNMLNQTEKKQLKSLAEKFYGPFVTDTKETVEDLSKQPWITPSDRKELSTKQVSLTALVAALGNAEQGKNAVEIVGSLTKTEDSLRQIKKLVEENLDPWKEVGRQLRYFGHVAGGRDASFNDVLAAYNGVVEALRQVQTTQSGAAVMKSVDAAFNAQSDLSHAKERIRMADEIAKETRLSLNHRKLLNHLIDEHEDKFIELVEGTRSHIATIDHYLKRLSIALEDDFKVQFYDPAFVLVREAAREREVNLGQVERTTILTNNRSFAKVAPQATMEFDLPKRQIAIKEAFDAAKALVEDSGALMNDPTFLAAFQMMGGSGQPSTVRNLVPGLPSSTDQQQLGLVPQDQQSGAPGSALQSLVPDPSIFKIETGTGFEIRPVIQPDGDSVVYDFNYMYTTNIREPVRADEKHLGRIKRHFVHTAVQTSSFELREISRYLVALKVSRTSRGVPLLEDIPIIGAAFRPAPSAESSLQQNIILGQTTVYPTLFDLMGLRWAPHVVDLDHVGLLDTEHIIRGRHQSIRDFVFDEATRKVDDILEVQQKSPDHYRPDLYHRQRQASPYHPGGYHSPSGVEDPSGHQFMRRDNRPPEMQDPPYDMYRHRTVQPELIHPGSSLEEIRPAPSPSSMRSSQYRTGPSWKRASTYVADSSGRFSSKTSPVNWKSQQYEDSNVQPANFDSFQLPTYGENGKSLQRGRPNYYNSQSDAEKTERLPPVDVVLRW